MDKSWMNDPDTLVSLAYAEGVKYFLIQARNHASGRARIRCPCHACLNNLWLPIPEVETHLFIKGINPNYTQWIFHGEEETTLSISDDDIDDDIIQEDDYIDDMQHMLDDIRAGTFVDVPQDSTPVPNRPSIHVDGPAPSFDQLLEDVRRPLFDGCTEFSKLSFVVKLLHIKSIGGWSIKSFDMLLDLLRSAFPNALLPQSYEESRSLERGLGFKYHKIHACPNNCILFWKENAALNECPHLFMYAKIAGDMRWPKEQQTKEDTSMRHPADSECWKKFDEDHGWFASDPRNVRLGLMIGDVQFGKSHRKKKGTAEELNWTKCSIFFVLPYWSTIRLRHNLDVMHIEKNIADNILWTLMNNPGKSKDNINSRRDLELLGCRKELHLRRDLNVEQRYKFCEWLSDIKFPDGFTSNILNCVSRCDCKISGLKSHDCHVFLKKLLPIAAGGYLRSDIGLALTELGTFFKELCARTLDVNCLTQFQTDVVTILCKLEMIFPPSFFDVMVHLTVHLSREARLGGPVQYR
ncbi:uncharacterized protein LOC118348663 [Juglans regia]|uniref:Uncharacterized protein LOC118348663 n=1 Tax=Juglans regia TaxID=51240 RepID=A0A6P9ERZ2_JUGRE|nr:uncharacterized protein LOC118348663 [Juglans regia]